MYPSFTCSPMDICTMLVAASAAQIIVAAALFVAHSISKEEHPEIIRVFLNSNMHHYGSDSPQSSDVSKWATTSLSCVMCDVMLANTTHAK